MKRRSLWTLENHGVPALKPSTVPVMSDHYIKTIAAAKAASPRITEPIKQRSTLSMATLSMGRSFISNVQKGTRFPSVAFRPLSANHEPIFLNE
jgi:hypothetical protein